MDSTNMQAATSYLLGFAYSSIKNILESETSDSHQVRMLEELELKMRTEIERLYYPMPAA